MVFVSAPPTSYVPPFSAQTTYVSSVLSAPITANVISTQSIGERFDGTNFVSWKTRLTPFLLASQLLSIVEGTEQAPPQHIPLQESNPSTASNWESNIHTLVNKRPDSPWVDNGHLHRTMVTQLSKHRTSASAWAYLSSSYAAQSSARASSLRMQLQTINEGRRSVTEYIQQATKLCDQLSAIGESISENEYLTHLFRGLGSEYDQLATAISVQTRANPLSREDLHGLLLSHEGRIELSNFNRDNTIFNQS